MDDSIEPACHSQDHASKGFPAIDPVGLERAAAIFRSMGDPGRLGIMALLAGGERCVTELAGATGDSLPAVSQRLKLLKAERLVMARRSGKHVHYRLADRHVVELVANAMEHASET